MEAVKRALPHLARPCDRVVKEVLAFVSVMLFNANEPVQVSACLCACMYVCLYFCLFVYICAYMFACLCGCIHACLIVCVFVCLLV